MNTKVIIWKYQMPNSVCMFAAIGFHSTTCTLPSNWSTANTIPLQLHYLPFTINSKVIGKVTALTFLDLSAAFITVHHNNILLHRLKYRFSLSSHANIAFVALTAC